MFIMYILNYPCNDSTYFWHIVSTSKDKFNDENNFVSKPMVSLIGVNSTYNDDIDTSPFSKYHYIVDIDNKKFFLKQSLEFSEDEDLKEFQNCKDLQTFIQNIIKDKDIRDINQKEKDKDKNIIESIFLKTYIDRLRKNLEFILSKNPDFTLSPKNKYVNFFKSSKDIMDKNKKIQEIFYDFNLNMLMIFYQDISLNSSSFDKIKKDKVEEIIKKIFTLKNIDKEPFMNKNERYFAEIFRSSIKYKIYFENFLQNFESIDAYKIPFYFSEEFINVKMKDITNKYINKLSLFNIIDSLYFGNNQQIISITLNNIYSAYFEKLKKYFKHFFVSDKVNENQLIIFNKKILNKYIYLLNNFYTKEELMEIFPSIRIQKSETIPKIDKRYIFYVTQNTLEQKNFVEISNYLIFSILYIFAISIPLHSYKKILIYLDSIINLLNKTKFFIRYHVYILLKTFYKYYNIHINKKIYPELTISTIKMYYFNIIDFLKSNLLIPNEEMMKILKHFFGELIYQERDSIIVKKEKEDENDFKIEKDVNFICIMKHCFTSKKMFKPNTMINAALKEYNNCNIIIRGGNKQLQPTISIKIKDYVYTSDFYSPKKIYKIIQQTYNDFDNADLEMSKLKIKNVRDIITNLIQYGIEINKNNKLIPVEFLIYILYLFKNHEDKYDIKNK